MTEIEAVEALLANMKRAKQLDEDGAHWLRSEVDSKCVAKDCTCNTDSELEDEVESFAVYLEGAAAMLREADLDSNTISEFYHTLRQSVRSFRSEWLKLNDR